MATLADMVTEVRSSVDIVGSTHITDAEIEAWIKKALPPLYERLILAYQDYAVTATTFVLTTSSAYSLPADTLKILRVDRSESGSASANDWTRLDRVNILDEPAWNRVGVTSWWQGARYGWLLQGSSLRIVPASRAAGTYQLLYYPAWVDPTTTVTIGPAGHHWEQLAVLDACVRALTKEERDPSAFLAQRAEMSAKLDAIVTNRHAGEAEPPPMPTYDWASRVLYGPGGWW